MPEMVPDLEGPLCLVGADVQTWAHELARLHALCFPETPWTAKDFAAFKTHVCVIEHEAGKAVGYALASHVCEEAELISLGVEVSCRGQGVAMRLMTKLHERLCSSGCEHIHLEVAESNISALRLYRGLDYHAVRTRTGYYERSDGPSEAAICMSCDLTPLVTTL